MAVDIVPGKVDQINNKKSPIADKEIEDFLAHKPLHLTATTDAKSAYEQAEFVIIATPRPIMTRNKTISIRQP